jgi:hypothetical protein
MTAGTRLLILIAFAAADITVDALCRAVAGQIPISNTHDLRAALQGCWVAPQEGAPRQISVRFSFNRDGRVAGLPLITYENPQPSQEGRAAVRDALTQTLARCEPLPLTEEFRRVISVHPITVRLGEGWRRRGRPAVGSER